MEPVEQIFEHNTDFLESQDYARVRFAGDSGDGMQLAGLQFASSTASAHNDFATRPDFPAEIRAPIGTVSGVSSYSITFGAADRQLALQNGFPLIFGKNREKGIRLNTQTLSLEVVEGLVEGETNDEILIHDETNRNLASLLLSMPYDDFPMPLGVIYADRQRTYEEGLYGQGKNNPTERKETTVHERLNDMKELLHKGNVWTVE